MNTNQANKILVGLLESADAPEQTATDLLDWFNRAGDFEQEELVELASLHTEGNFEAWNCPSCGARVYWATPEDWGNFQGTCNADYVSYPGNRKQCDHCRCHMKPLP